MQRSAARSPRGSGVFHRTISRQDSPRHFWTVIIVYASLSVALMTVF
jgi:hypothetical protein